MHYKNKRKHKEYFGIIENSVEWWTDKLKNDKLKFAPRVNVAFAFKVNGLSVIRVTQGQLKLKDGQVIKLTDDNIAADGSGYTKSDKLRAIYKL